MIYWLVLLVLIGALAGSVIERLRNGPLPPEARPPVDEDAQTEPMIWRP